MSLALARTSRSSSLQRTLRSSSDRALQDNIKALETSRDELSEINDFLKSALNLPSDRKRSWLAKGLHFVIPQKFYAHLPNAVAKLVAEEFDVLELIEGLMRKNINNVQDALTNLAVCSIQKKEDIDELALDIQKAQEEKWDALQLHQYMMERANIQIRQEIVQLLDSEFNFLSPEEREVRKEELIKQLESNIVIGRSLVATTAKVCSAGLGILHRAAGQYFDYANVYRPIAVIRDSAQTLTDTNRAMYASKDAVVATFETSLKAIETAVEAARMVNNYAIASADMKNILEAGHKRLDNKLRLLETERRKIATELQAPNRARLPEKNVIDIEPVPAQAN